MGQDPPCGEAQVQRIVHARRLHHQAKRLNGLQGGQLGMGQRRWAVQSGQLLAVVLGQAASGLLAGVLACLLAVASGGRGGIESGDTGALLATAAHFFPGVGRQIGAARPSEEQ